MEHVESSSKIYFSNNYGDFKFMKGNRDINETKINKILKSIEEDDIDILKFSPILVDDDMSIIDGQHRFYVSKKLKRPVFYCIISKVGLRGVTKINSNSSNWKIKDFLNSYCDLKKEAYLEISKLQENYRINTTIAASLLHSGQIKCGNIKDLFLDGDLELNHLIFTEELLAQASEISPYIKSPHSRRMLTAIIRLNKCGLYKQDEMIEKFKQSGKKIESYIDAKDVINQMELIMNFKAKQRVIIYK